MADARAVVAGLRDRFRRHLRTTGLIEPGQTVVVAVSGGLDSVVLLHLLRFGLQGWGLRLVAAHFDHRMRPSSAADADWVSGLCRAWAVPLERGRAEETLGSEAAARSARYRFLRAVERRRAADRVVTAHHADDQAETVLFRAVRGTGLRGLGGIPARRDTLVRPLLPFRRRQLEAYARAQGLRYRIDPTNRTLDYARNRLRHDVIPRLESIAPGATDALVRLAEHARAEEAAWDQVLSTVLRDVVVDEEEGAVVLARPRLLSYHAHVRARVLRRLLRRFGSRPDRAGTTALLKFINSSASGGRFSVAGGVVVEREFDRIRIRRRTAPEARAAEDRPLVIGGPGNGSGEAVIGGRRFLVRWTTDGAGTETEGVDQAVFDPEALRFPLELRGWCPGDRMRLSYGTKKLTKLFAERRIGRLSRTRVPVLAQGDGRVVWVAGVAQAAAVEPVPGHPIFRIYVTNA